MKKNITAVPEILAVSLFLALVPRAILLQQILRLKKFRVK